MIDQNAHIHSIYRYPVKGLSPELLLNTTLVPGATLAADRLYAIENGPSNFDPLAPRHQPKMRYLMLMRNERLAKLRTHFKDEDHTLTVKLEGRETARGDLREVNGRTRIEQFFAKFCADELRGPPRILFAPGHSFSDVAKKVVSIINMASVAELENAIGAPVHHLRFRGNVYLEGWPAWSEFDLIGREITMAGTRLKVIKRIVRCAATNVDPDTGQRDLSIPETLMKSFGHADCGVYAEVVTGGAIRVGDMAQTGNFLGGV
jgi:uncharacterized protein YcbX